MRRRRVPPNHPSNHGLTHTLACGGPQALSRGRYLLARHAGLPGMLGRDCPARLARWRPAGAGEDLGRDDSPPSAGRAGPRAPGARGRRGRPADVGVRRRRRGRPAPPGHRPPRQHRRMPPHRRAARGPRRPGPAHRRGAPLRRAPPRCRSRARSSASTRVTTGSTTPIRPSSISRSGTAGSRRTATRPARRPPPGTPRHCSISGSRASCATIFSATARVS